jgi:hypothetical protein
VVVIMNENEMGWECYKKSKKECKANIVFLKKKKEKKKRKTRQKMGAGSTLPAGFSLPEMTTAPCTLSLSLNYIYR